MTAKDLEARMCILGEGDTHTIDVQGSVKFKVCISWQDGQTPDYEIKDIEVAEHVKTSVILSKWLQDKDFLTDYFLEQNSNLLTTFQKKIDEFDADAQDWGMTNHKTPFAFYEMHVW